MSWAPPLGSTRSSANGRGAQRNSQIASMCASSGGAGRRVTKIMP